MTLTGFSLGLEVSEHISRGCKEAYLRCVHENALSELPSAQLHLQSRAAGDGDSGGLVSAKHCKGLKNK